MSKTRHVLLMLLGLSLLRPVTAAMLAAMLPDASVNPVPQCIAGMVLSVVLLGLPACMQRPWRSERLPQQKRVWSGVLMGTGAALLVRAAMTPVDIAWQATLGLTADALPVPGNVPVAMLYVAALAIVPALTEEAFFRGALLTGLLDGSRRVTAAMLTSISFALMHGSLANLPSLLVLSAMLTLLMLRTGRIAVSMAAHFVYNLTALNWGSLPLWGSGLCGLALIALAARLISCRSKFAHPPMQKMDGLIAAAALAALAACYLI